MIIEVIYKFKFMKKQVMKYLTLNDNFDLTRAI